VREVHAAHESSKPELVMAAQYWTSRGFAYWTSTMAAAAFRPQVRERSMETGHRDVAMSSPRLKHLVDEAVSM